MCGYERCTPASRGTELAAYRGTSPYLHKRWDTERRLFLHDGADVAPHFPLTSWGYEEVGEVIEAGPEAGVVVGEVVFGTGGTVRMSCREPLPARAVPPGTTRWSGSFAYRTDRAQWRA